MKNRILALLLTLCLLGAIPAGALAEDAPISAEPVEDVSEEVEIADLSLLMDEEEEEDEESPSGETVAAQTEFVEGFATTVEAALLYDDDFNVMVENLPVGTVLYVVQRSEDGQALVACDLDGVAARLWVDVSQLRPMDEDAISAYIEAAHENPDTLWLDEGHPLTAIHGRDAAAVQPALKLDPEKLSLAPGETYAFSLENVAWSVADEEVATISETGVVTAVSTGETDITATAEDGATAVCHVLVDAASKGLHFQVSTLTLGLKESSSALTKIFTDQNKAAAGAVSYTTSNKKYVTVSSAGVVKGVKKGSATITATNSSGEKAVCVVTVVKAPSNVTVTPEKLTLAAGQSRPLTYTISSGSSGAVTWSSKKTGVAQVDPITGVVTAVAAGTTEVVARAFNGKKDSVKLTVIKAPTKLSFPQSALSIGVGQKFAASVDQDAYDVIEYQIQDPNVVSVTDGALVGVAAGTTKVTARTFNGLTATCKVTVTAAPPYVKLPWTSVVIGVNDTLQLHPDSNGCTDVYTYTSSKTKYVKVSETGLVRGVKSGKADITIKTYNGKSCKLRVEVLKAPTSVTISPKTHSMGVGDKFTLTYSLPKKTGGTATFESSKPSVATVNSETGEVTAVGAGTAIITVRTYNNRTDTCTVTVNKAPTSIKLNSELIELGAGQTFQLVPTLSAGSASAITYESVDPAVATVSADGVVTGVGYGSTTVYVRTAVAKVYATATVTAWDAPSSVKLKETTLSKLINEKFTLSPIIPEKSRTEFTFTSSNEKVAVVSARGEVSTVGKGQAVITVTTHNDKKAALSLTVLDPWYPESLTLSAEPSMLKIGDTYQVKYKVTPSTAEPSLMWNSSDTTVATVDKNGKIKAVGMGYANITAVSLKNEALTLELTVAVETDSVTLVIPARTTGESGIKANLAKIDAVRKSAIAEIERLTAKKVISSSDASKRKSMVNDIFANYAFPWKTLKLQKYWKAANSEGGAKDFKTDRVYYGLPYISGSGKNRHYDVALALKENRYYDSGDGYYILNQNKLLGGKYVGNDCSGLVNVSIWGTSSSRASDRTDDIASSKYYRTISDWTDMRPGDLICKSSAHVVMFLYYVNAARTEFMMIENGGAEPGTNTVHCDIYEASYYQSRKYKIRRLATLG